MEALFPDNPARRITKKEEGGRTGVKKANESDVSLTRSFLADGRSRRVTWRTSRSTKSCEECMLWCETMRCDVCNILIVVL
jgi:hypothetical protein